MTIAAILQGKGSEVIRVDKEMSVQSVVALLAERRIGCVPVVEKGRVVGIFSERDVIYGLERDGAAILDRTVGDVMTSPAMTIEPATPVISALSLMTQRRVRHLPVVDGEALIGFVSIGDLVKHRIDRIEAEASAMRDYIQSV